MKILGIDTSTKYLSVAITDGGKLSGVYSQECAQMHAARLVPVVKKLLQKAKMRLSDLDALAVSIGPGSFTGLRIGVSTAKGLVIADKIPVVPVPTMDAIAKNAAHHSGKVCVILDARKQQVYACLYEVNPAPAYKGTGVSRSGVKRVSPYMLLKIEDLLEKLKGEILFLGDAIDIYKKEIEKDKKLKPVFAEQELWYPDPYWVCEIGERLFEARKTVSAEDLVPMYIYLRECTITKPVTRNQ